MQNKKYIIEVRRGKEGEKYIDPYGVVKELEEKDPAGCFSAVIVGEYIEPWPLELPWHSVSHPPDKLETVLLLGDDNRISRIIWYETSSFLEEDRAWIYEKDIPLPKFNKSKFKIGESVKKIKGSQWQGFVVGTYSTELTKEGYAVESSTEKGSVQIYPAAALEKVKE